MYIYYGLNLHETHTYPIPTVPVVGDYIARNIIQSDLWDLASDEVKIKAVGMALEQLYNVVSDAFTTVDLHYNIHVLPPEPKVVAYQALWLLRIDDTFQRAEMGTTSVWVDGTMITLKEKDYSISPWVLRMFKLPYTMEKGTRRKIGGYANPIPSTNRMSNITSLNGFYNPYALIFDFWGYTRPGEPQLLSNYVKDLDMTTFPMHGMVFKIIIDSEEGIVSVTKIQRTAILPTGSIIYNGWYGGFYG